MSDETAGQEGRPGDDGAQNSAPRRRANPLLPEAGSGGAPLTAVIAIISFLAVLAMAAALIINDTASDWTSELRSEITIQVKGADASAIAEGASAVMEVLNETEGVRESVLMSEADTAALLEPWFGRDNAAAFLNIPALIEVKVTPVLRNDLDSLRDRVRAAAPGATIDDHAEWHSRLASAARSGQALAFAVFVIVLGAACAIAMFAARAGLAANHEIVSLLHIVGATDTFIAKEVQRRFFVLGLRGALVGFAAALGALAIVAVGLRAGVGLGTFLPRFAIGGWLVLWLFAVPVVTCLVTAYSARLTVLRALREQY